MDGRFNTIAGWVLGAGIVLLGAKLVTDELFHAEAVEHGGFPIAGVDNGEDQDGEAELPIAHFLQTADAGRGEGAFRSRCTVCHTINQGGANGTGPNLYGTMGANLAHVAGFAYSDALRSKGGTWNWEAMSEWLRSPRTFAPGTKMTFAGLSDPQDRANLLLYLNQQGGSLTIPPPPAAAPAEGNAAEGNAVEGNATEANAAAPAANAAAPH